MIHFYGCSFTKYNWPTYADILGEEAVVKNQGNSGSGNEQIFYHLLSDLRDGRITEDSTVICQWSGSNRFQYLTKNNTWIGDGNIFLPQNKKIYKKIKSFYNPQYELEKSRNLILATKNILQNYVKKYLFLSMPKLIEHTYHSTEFDNLKQKYVGYYTFTKNCDWYYYPNYVYEDTHPTVLQHLNIAKKICRYLNISITDDTIKRCRELEDKIITEKNFTTYYLH